MLDEATEKLGLIAGFLAGQVMKGGGYGLVGDIVLGIIGAVVGGFLASTLLGLDVNGFNITNAFKNLNFGQVPFEAIAEQQIKTGGYGADELQGAGAYRVYRDAAELMLSLDELGVL